LFDEIDFAAAAVVVVVVVVVVVADDDIHVADFVVVFVDSEKDVVDVDHDDDELDGREIV
jgi:hypothetical protein